MLFRPPSTLASIPEISGLESGGDVSPSQAQPVGDFLHQLKYWLKPAEPLWRWTDISMRIAGIPFSVWFPCFVTGIACIFVICLYILHIVGFCYGKYRLNRKVNHDTSQPGVSIIKPIVGSDGNLEQNLKSFFSMEYHKFELLFCFHNNKDSGVEIVKKLIKQNTKVDARVFYGGESVGPNPKINNMMPAYRASKYPLVLISDSGILMRPDALMDMVNSMTPDVAIVTQMPYCKDRPGFAGALEQVYFGTSHGRIYLAGNAMGFVCSTGMSSLLRRSALEDCGGIQAFSGFLAEDFFFGLEMARRGWRATISCHPALQNTAHITVSSFHARICRWMKLRIAMLPHIIFVEPLQDVFASGLLMSFALWYLFSINPVMYYILHVSGWCILDYHLLKTIQNGPLRFSFFYYLLIWTFRELFGPVIFIRALLNPDIKWRHGRFRLHWGGKIKTA